LHKNYPPKAAPHVTCFLTGGQKDKELLKKNLN